MEKQRRARIWKGLKIAALAYVACGIALYFLQEKFLFHPRKVDLTETYRFDQPFREINLPVTEERNLNIIQFTVPDSTCRGIVLYFHGNRNNIGRYAGYAPFFTRNNYEVWMMDYPGFGKSNGAFTEEGLYSDARLLYKMARARFGPDSLIIYGRSLGTGVASQLASIRDCKRLMLETPYYSVDALTQHYAFMYPAWLMSKYHFPNNEYLPNVKVPVQIFHGTDDEVIPFEQSERLFPLAKNPQSGFTGIENGRHNNLSEFPRYGRTLDSLLQQH